MQVLTTTIVSSKPRHAWAVVLAPSLTDFFFGALLLWLVLGGGCVGLLGDGDTGWHIRTGDYILEHHAVPRQDIFTFSRPNEPWFAWEWLIDVLFSGVHRIWGLKAIGLLAAVVLCGTATVLLCHMLWRGGNIFVALLAALLAHGASTVHFLARPHVFTFLLLAVCLWLLARDARRPDRAVWLLAPIMAVWVNLHAGFLALFACLGMIVAGHGLAWLIDRGTESRFFAQRYLVLTAACALASLVNPYGFRLHLHVVEFLRSTFALDFVEEFQSPKFRGENMLQYEILLFAALALAGVMISRKRFPEALLMLFWAQASLKSARHVPLFVIVAAPIIVDELTELWNAWSRHKSRKSIAGVFRELGNEFSSHPLRASIWGPVVFLGLGIFMASASPAKNDIWPADFPKARFPVAMVNQYVQRLAPATGHMPRIFTSDQWGDYLTYHFYPRMRIFIDGRSDLFGITLGKEYVHAVNGHYEWESVLDRYRIEMALVPIDWPLAELLKQNPGWRLIKDDGMAILFERRTPVLMKTEVSAERLNSTTRSLRP